MSGADGLGPLAPGDRVALVYPAGPTPPEQRARAESASVASDSENSNLPTDLQSVRSLE